ncbi:ATP-binding protein [Chitinophaga sp. Mgbs1]|uniref:ATP-binding protein n=1 Tax=Chitinophaga solisilvae TaxID=1233460 RepID=A0A433WM47_9BACT|nr:ATP-binding protein [Chitinophaga solisilvae]
MHQQQQQKGTYSYNWDYYFHTLASLITRRIQACFSDDSRMIALLPPLDRGSGPMADFVAENKLTLQDHYMLLIALAPHLRPGFFDEVIQAALPQPGDFPQIGGVRGRQFRGFLPTAETALFLLAGDNWKERHELFQDTFGPDHFFSQKNILQLETPPDGEPLISGKLLLSQSMVTWFTTGREYLPMYTSQFPARELKTALTWKDVILNPQTLHQLQDLRAWHHHSKKLFEDMGLGKKVGPGYRALFYGPPGTGKTISTAILGKEFGKTVFRIDLSSLVSKYIGETEKNLARVFEEAGYRNWILFFDEADALFGKRTQVKDAHDRYANQEVSYLMQRIETFDGMVILASNLKGNMDDAFVRRFQSIIYFPYPTPDEQVQIWRKAFPARLQPAPDIDLQQIAQRHKLSGANIMNIVQYCCLAAMAAKEKKISGELLLQGIQRELSKEGKTF